ncbi:MAG: hypothetical protein KA314_18480, partial [Chloroflexi bacterium]|nr:hypothetical protein [Chloroflexota bacterium]
MSASQPAASGQSASGQRPVSQRSAASQPAVSGQRPATELLTRYNAFPTGDNMADKNTPFRATVQ